MEDCIMEQTIVCKDRLVTANHEDTSVQVCHVPSLQQLTLKLSCSVSFPSIQDLARFADTEILCVSWESSQMYQDRSLELLCEWLPRLLKLKRLELENYRVHGHCRLFLTLAKRCRNLESLSLQASGAHMGRMKVVEEKQAWGEMLKLPHLKDLSLFGINFASGDIFDQLEDSTLETFTFWRCRVSRESDNLLKGLARCESLKTLQLHHMDQRQIHATLPPNLVSLHLSLVALSTETCLSIQGHDKLRQVRLTGCSFIDLPFNPQWESYGVYHTNVEALPAFGINSLNTLELVDCNLDDDKLDVAFVPAKLKYLNLSHNPGVSSKLLARLLTKCGDLECLQIAGMNVGVAGFSAAVAAHYWLSDLVTDEEIPGNVESYLRLNQAGRRYLKHDQTSFNMSANVLGEVSCHLNDIYTHLLETPSICNLLDRR